ncbi:ribosomal protein S6 [Tolypothrix sp. PCC 7601]|nr:ribosomal protein S6 [Tolypothrix sp. PCC 7601]
MYKLAVAAFLSIRRLKTMSIVYETMFILRPDLGDEQVEQAITKYQNLLKEHGAEDIQIQNRGKRRLAYEIKKQRDGIYIQFNYTGPGTAIAPVERAMRLSEEVIRYLTIKQDVHEEKAAQVAVSA